MKKIIKKNVVIFFVIFIILQSLFFYLYLKQNRSYLFEFRAFVSSNENIGKKRTYNEAVNLIYNEITNSLNFENDEIKILGNISKRKMSEIDWHLKWFGRNQSLFFSIIQSEKNLKSILENDLLNNFSKILNELKINYSNKINKLNQFTKILNNEELNKLNKIKKFTYSRK